MTTATAEAAHNPVVKLLVKGFNPMERRLLDGTVKLSERRAPRIELVADADATDADVVLIDAQETSALQWAAAQPWLAGKPAIWAGAKAVRPQHTLVERHLKWPILPVLLYRAIEHAQLAPRATPAPAPAAASRSVLVIDDSLAVRNHLQSLLERAGATVTTAASAEEGIALTATQPFACVLMDVLMPGIDGFEACRRIKAKRAHLPVVMLTSKSSPFDRVRGKMAGCDTYLTKPVDPVQLRETVGRHLPSLNTNA
ncbi:response regulator transcription factor [Ramlibacter sp. PS4R-6]|uniref:response regulator transcription factor n=1 Tax=Ramlibacter sp. PS4R-6 TaxID=3133438 RepID=UPI003099360D